MLLQNQELHSDLLHIDVVADYRVRRERDATSSGIDGMFFEHEGRLFGLGVDSGTIFLILDNQLLKHNAKLAITLDQSQGSNVFTATQDSQALCQVTYKPIRASGWIANEDDECLDGFLWIYNVANDTNRIQIITANSPKDG